MVIRLPHKEKQRIHTHPHPHCFSPTQFSTCQHIIRQISSGAPPFASRRQRKSSGGPGAGSSIKLGFLCPLLVEPPSAGTQDLQDCGGPGARSFLERRIQAWAFRQRSGRGRVFVLWVFQFIFGTSSCLNVCVQLSLQVCFCLNQQITAELIRSGETCAVH